MNGVLSAGRTVLVLLILLGVMLGLAALKQGGHPLTLASVGFVVLASFMAADLGSLFTLPRVTGYILAGALLGPQIANVLSNGVVAEIKMFNTLALGLIAVSAGLELDLKSLKSIAKTLLLTTLLKVVLCILLVGGLLYVVESKFGVLSQGDPAKVLALALVFGVLAIGTSPSITLAVMTETKAKGRMPELVLGAAVLKDLVVVVLLAIAIAIAGSQFAEAAEHSVLQTLALHLGGSVLCGAVFGVIYILYIRFVKAEMLLFVAATILVAAEISIALHLELLLVLIVAGFVVRNFSTFAHDLLRPVEMVSLPVFVVFFTTAGAAIDLRATLSLLPIAGGVVVLRAAIFFIASRYGGRWGGESEAVQRRAWLGYLPQAGVTLGLVGMAAGQLPAVGAAIASLGTAMVALNLLIGPITLRRVLLAGDEDAQLGVAPQRTSLRSLRALPQEIARELSLAVDRLREETQNVSANLAPRLDVAIRERLEEGLSSEDFAIEDVNWAFAEDAWPQVSELSAELLGFLDESRVALKETPAMVQVPLLSEDYAADENDSLLVRLRLGMRRAAAFFVPRLRRREVPLQLFLRTEMEPALCAASRDITVAYVRMRLSVMAAYRAAAIGSRSVQESMDTAIELGEQFQNSFAENVDKALDDATSALRSRLMDYDGPRKRIPFPSSRKAEIAWSSQLQKLVNEPPEWERILTAEVALLQVEVTLWETRRQVREHLDGLTQELEPIWASHWRSLDAWRSWLDRVGKDEQSSERSAHLERLEAFQRTDVAQGVGQIVIRTSRELHELALAFRAVSQQLPESLVVYRSPTALEEVRVPEDLYRHTILPRKEFLDSLVDQLIPAIEIAVDQVSERSDLLNRGMNEGQALMLESLNDAERGVQLVMSLNQAESERAHELLEEFDALQLRWEESLVDVVQRGFEQLSDSLTRSNAQALTTRHSSSVFRTLLRLREWSKQTLRRAMRVALLPVVRTVQEVNRFLELPAGLRAGEPRQARDCADEIRKWTAPFGDLPPAYAKLFAAEPLREPKLLVGRDEQIKEILAVEGERGAGSSILIDGEPGSGRTSLFNVVQFQLSAARVLRLENPRSERVSWRYVLAETLNCAPRLSTIRRELEREVTTVLLDDLEEWLSPRPHELQQDLDEFSSLVVATRRSTCWLVSLSSDAHRLYREVSGLDQAFFKTVELEALKAQQLGELLERRHRRSGLKLYYEPTVVTRWIGRLKGADARSVFLRYLSRVTEGNPSRALLTWCNQLHIDGNNAREEVDLSWSLGLQFITRFGPMEVAILVQLSRYRRLTSDELLETLNCSRLDLTRTLAFLEMARLISSERWKATWYTLKPWLRPLIHHALPRGLMRG